VKLAGEKINIKNDIRDQKATITEKIKELESLTKERDEIYAEYQNNLLKEQNRITEEREAIADIDPIQKIKYVKGEKPPPIDGMILMRDSQQVDANSPVRILKTMGAHLIKEDQKSELEKLECNSPLKRSPTKKKKPQEIKIQGEDEIEFYNEMLDSKLQAIKKDIGDLNEKKNEKI